MKAKTIAAFVRLETSVNQLLNHVSSIPSDQLTKKIDANTWSLLEILEHLYLSEKLALDYLARKRSEIQTRNESAFKYYFRGLTVRLALILPLKFKIPKKAAIQPVSNIDFASLTSNWNELHNQMRTILQAMEESSFNSPLFKHPSVGKMRLIDGYKLLYVHFQHHLHQVNKSITNNTK